MGGRLGGSMHVWAKLCMLLCAKTRNEPSTSLCPVLFYSILFETVRAKKGGSEWDE